MGMFDWINFEMYCPICGNKVIGFQSKSANCNLEYLDFWQVDNFYSSCEQCGTWIEFRLKKDRKFTIDDYELNLRKK